MASRDPRRSLSLRGTTYRTLIDRAVLLGSSPSSIVEALIAKHLLDPKLAPRGKMCVAKAERITAVAVLDEDEDLSTRPIPIAYRTRPGNAGPTRWGNRTPTFDAVTKGPPPQAGGDVKLTAEQREARRVLIATASGRIGGGF